MSKCGVLRAAGALLCLLSWPAHAQDRIAVAAGESFRQALQTISARYRADGGSVPEFTFASSAALAGGIEKGVPTDIVICAQSWADTLDKEQLIDHASRADILGDHLVLIAPAGSATRIAVGPHFALLPALGGGRLALADPEKAQTGRYTKQALSALGVWDEVLPVLLPADNVRAALAAVARHDAALGIVYQTDLQDQNAVQVAGTFPDDSHPPIAYTFALLKTAGPAARRFFDYLKSPVARAAYEKAGFVSLDGK